MNTRAAMPRIPVDESSDLHKLALAIQASQHEHMGDRNFGAVTICNSALEGLGYKDWGIGSSTPPVTPSRRSRLFDLTANYEWAGKLKDIVLALGFNPEFRDCGRAWDPLEAFVAIDKYGDDMQWGLLETRGRHLACWRFDHLRLEVQDHGETLVTKTTEGLRFTNPTSLSALGLDDDDYRFVIAVADSAGKGGWNRYNIDMAIIDGVWTQLDYQGRDWDGEWNGE